MNGIHDMGGRHGFGRVVREDDEPTFHTAWEGRVRTIASLLLVKGCFNIDSFRHAIERLEPSAYLTHGYYGRWLGGLETLVRELGEELAVGRVVGGAQAKRGANTPPRFAGGDAVRTRNLQPPGTRAYPRTRETSAARSATASVPGSSRTRMPMTAGRVRNSSIRSASRATSCGAKRPSPGPACS